VRVDAAAAGALVGADPVGGAPVEVDLLARRTRWPSGLKTAVTAVPV
jgi:hypothetical protein